MKLLSGALAVAALALPAAQAASPTTVPGLVYTAGYGNSIVTSYDPETLVRSGPRIRLGGNANSWSWSARRRYLAVASYPQRLTILEMPSMRVVARVRLAAGGGVVRAVTWLSRERVVALIDTPRGVLLSVVDTVARRVVSRALFPRAYALEFERIPGGLVFLVGTHGRIEPVRIVVVDAEGRLRIAAVPQVPAGFVVRREQQVPGLAVDSAGQAAYVVGGDRVFPIDLRTLSVSDRGPLRTLAKLLSGTTRSAEWLGNGLLAFSGADWDAQNGGTTPAGLRIVDVRSWRVRVVDRGASSFTVAGGHVLVERATNSRALTLVAYGLDGGEGYRLEFEGPTWLKKQGRIGYVCRYAFLRSVIDLTTGRTLRTGFPAETRCPTLLAGDSRS